MTTSNTTPVINTNSYPFATKAQIKAELNSSFDARCAAIVTLFKLQTTLEQATDKTLMANRNGFMSSHAVNGSKIAKKLLAGEELDSDDINQVNRIAPRYSRQLATLARAEALAANPELAEKAAVFGIK
jgi:hypothetical protein